MKKRKSESAPQRASGPIIPERFVEQIREHRDRLDWTQATLSEESGISQSQLSGWLKSQTRTVGRDQVCRLAFAFAKGYEASKEVRYGIDQLDVLLNSLLSSAGFSALEGRPKDIVWTRLQSEPRKLRVGWTNYPPFCSSAGSRGGSEELSGIAVDITRRLAELTGLQIDWVNCQWGEIQPALNSGIVDVICPILMVLPTRMLEQVLFSDKIPIFSLAVNGVALKEHIAKIRAIAKAPFLESTTAVAANAIRGEVGVTLRRIVLPISSLGRVYETVEEAIWDLSEEPIDPITGDVKCLIADHTICIEILRQKKDLFDLVYPRSDTSPVKLPIAFGTHVGEESLSRLINTCLQLMHQSEYFDILATKYESALKKFGVVVSDRGASSNEHRDRA